MRALTQTVAKEYLINLKSPPHLLLFNLHDTLEDFDDTLSH